MSLRIANADRPLTRNRDDALAAIRAGDSFRTIADRYGVTLHAVSHLARRHGLGRYRSKSGRMSHARAAHVAPELLAAVKQLRQFISDAPSLDFSEDRTLSAIAVYGAHLDSLIAKAEPLQARDVANGIEGGE